ncbi:hypothetical protein OS493_030016 [Desmophyllum pertusum]|uniref:Uncharacterized protein n=1 Tax=Desmophyllum pertusum TaxID=174260 RepID=A0A9W9ZNH9_9CNID|nr:hypothetical protein OS493_030016 [Desmophyllum pertusum]
MLEFNLLYRNFIDGIVNKHETRNGTRKTRTMNWLIIAVTTILVLSQDASCNPLSRDWRAWRDDCPPGVWGCKRTLSEEMRNDEDCPPGVWGCKKNVIAERDVDCPPGVWGCKRGLFGSVENWFSSNKGKSKSKRSVIDINEDCPPGVWGCKREIKKEDFGEEGCPPGVWGCKKDEVENDCPPGVWGCKRNKVQKKEEEKKDDVTADADCPPGVWGCKRGN